LAAGACIRVQSVTEYRAVAPLPEPQRQLGPAFRVQWVARCYAEDVVAARACIRVSQRSKLSPCCRRHSVRRGVCPSQMACRGDAEGVVAAYADYGVVPPSDAEIEAGAPRPEQQRLLERASESIGL
jgi:hypothetical protein